MIQTHHHEIANGFAFSDSETNYERLESTPESPHLAAGDIAMEAGVEIEARDGGVVLMRDVSGRRHAVLARDVRGIHECDGDATVVAMRACAVHLPERFDDVVAAVGWNR